MLTAKFERVYARKQGKKTCDIARKANAVEVPGLAKAYRSQFWEHLRKFRARDTLARRAEEAAFDLCLNRWQCCLRVEVAGHSRHRMHNAEYVLDVGGEPGQAEEIVLFDPGTLYQVDGPDVSA